MLLIFEEQVLLYSHHSQRTSPHSTHHCNIRNRDLRLKRGMPNTTANRASSMRQISLPYVNMSSTGVRLVWKVALMLFAVTS